MLDSWKVDRKANSIMINVSLLHENIDTMFGAYFYEMNQLCNFIFES